MAITTFAELKAAIEDYLVRTNAQLNARTEDFIALFEGRRRKRLSVTFETKSPGGGSPAPVGSIRSKRHAP
jgi:hypothetical protein